MQWQTSNSANIFAMFALSLQKASLLLVSTVCLFQKTQEKNKKQNAQWTVCASNSPEKKAMPLNCFTDSDKFFYRLPKASPWADMTQNGRGTLLWMRD